MKLPRNSKILRSPFDAAPFAAVFFLLVIFLMLGALMPTPGLAVKLDPPKASNLPGTDQPTVSMAVDADGSYYFENQNVPREKLAESLHAATRESRAPLTLLIHADRRVTYQALMEITLLARDAGITNALLATLPDEEPVPSTKR